MTYAHAVPLVVLVVVPVVLPLLLPQQRLRRRVRAGAARPGAGDAAVSPRRLCGGAAVAAAVGVGVAAAQLAVQAEAVGPAADQLAQVEHCLLLLSLLGVV